MLINCETSSSVCLHVDFCPGGSAGASCRDPSTGSVLTCPGVSLEMKTHSVLEMIICSLRAFSYQVSGGIVSVLLLLLCFCCQGSFCSFTYGKQMRCDSLSLSEVTSYRCLKLVVVSSLNFGLHCLPRLLLLLLLRWCVRIQENVQKYR